MHISGLNWKGLPGSLLCFATSVLLDYKTIPTSEMIFRIRFTASSDRNQRDRKLMREGAGVNIDTKYTWI